MIAHPHLKGPDRQRLAASFCNWQNWRVTRNKSPMYVLLVRYWLWFMLQSFACKSYWLLLLQKLKKPFSTANHEPKCGANRSCLVTLFGKKIQLTSHRLLLASLSDPIISRSLLARKKVCSSARWHSHTFNPCYLSHPSSRWRNPYTLKIHWFHFINFRIP